jgi:hypothetical protein
VRIPANVIAHSGIVTTDSGRSRKSVTMRRTTGYDRPESVVTMGRNPHPGLTAG